MLVCVCELLKLGDCIYFEAKQQWKKQQHKVLKEVWALLLCGDERERESLEKENNELKLIVKTLQIGKMLTNIHFPGM